MSPPCPPHAEDASITPPAEAGTPYVLCASVSRWWNLPPQNGSVPDVHHRDAETQMSQPIPIRLRRVREPARGRLSLPTTMATLTAARSRPLLQPNCVMLSGLKRFSTSPTRSRDEGSQTPAGAGGPEGVPQGRLASPDTALAWTAKFWGRALRVGRWFQDGAASQRSPEISLILVFGARVRSRTVAGANLCVPDLPAQAGRPDHQATDDHRGDEQRTGGPNRQVPAAAAKDQRR